MPLFDAAETLVCSNPNQDRSSDDVANKSQGRADDDQDNSAHNIEGIKLSEKK